MPGQGEIRKCIHGANGAVSVIEAFLKKVDASTFDDDMQALHEAAMRCLERLRNALRDAGEAAKGL